MPLFTPLSIKEQWVMFEGLVIPRDAPPDQLREMKRAFYAGAAALMQINVRLGDDDISEDEGCRVLDRINGELSEFSRRIQEGKA